MFSAIMRLFRNIGYLLSGNLNKMSGGISKNPDVIMARYDKIVEDKRRSLNAYKDAVGGMIGTEVKKQEALKVLTEEIVRLEKLKSGALAKAKQVVARHESEEASKADPEYLKCHAAYRDFSSTLEEKQKRAVELEEDIKTILTNVNTHKVQIERLMRDLDKIKNEKFETVAELVSAEEEKKIADMFSGISVDQSSKELEEMREMRIKAKGAVKISRDLAGLDTAKQEEDFMAYAAETDADDEFSKLLHATKKDSETASKEPVKLSEI
jgi:phage shock protein A